MIDEKQNQYPVSPSQPLTEADLKTLAERKQQKQVPEKPTEKVVEKKKAIKLEEAAKIKRVH